MNKFIVSILLAGSVLAPSLASAFTLQDNCSADPFTEQTCLDEQAAIRRGMGGGIPALIMMPWGLTGGQTPWFDNGTSVADRYQNVYQCPDWFPQLGCYDITNTDYYLSRVHGFLNIQ